MQRASKAFHHSDNFKAEYEAIKNAYMLMKAVDSLEVPSNPAVLIKMYQEDMYLIDSYYRWFYYAYDQIVDNERFVGVRQQVENIYTNTYLHKSVPRWNGVAKDEIVQNIGLIRQTSFFNHYLRAYDGKERVIVIISDALRYECAKELMIKFDMDEKCDAKMDAMLGVLPSVTSMGMASLLPHSNINVDANMIVTVDGEMCADLSSRDKILKTRNENNCAVSFDVVAKANKATVRELLQGKNIVYIYHNQVDARGDKPASENEVFNACAEAIDEIFKLIKKLTGDISATKYFITADHGFLYKRDKLQEFDKVSFPKEVCTYSNKRFLLTTDKVNEQGVISRALTYLNKMNELYVTTPIGTDIFKVAGGGQNYVHGGSSLQEMLIPVVEVKTAKGKQETDFVDVILTTVSRKVTNLTTYFDFIQTEKVTDVMKGRNIVAFFTAESGEKISYDVPMIAASQSDAPENRSFHEKFTLKSRKYAMEDKYYLNIADANDEKNVLHSYEFVIDIAFVDDFGFF
ncbi:MAG: BREX-1 system phosphatase PglZ type A, partial [Ruminococcus flavefaciens]|nr:BREX-1 system phosphatase PglZ type A [Ruminococcus flavefaciens]